MSALSRPVQRVVAVLLLLLLVLLVDAALQPLRQRLDADARALALAQGTLVRYRTLLAGASAPAEAARGVLLEEASASQAAAALQAQIKAAAIAAGARLDSVEALNAGAADDGRLVLRARLTADTKSLQALLYRLEAARPVLLVDQLYVRARTGRADGTRHDLDVRFDLIGFLAPGAGA